MKFGLKTRLAIGSIATLVLAELLLRGLFGLGTPPLLQADPQTGYRFQPNQRLVRFGKRIEYNQYSQRSQPISAEKPAGTYRILMVGDSILNGGSPTDQSETISEQFASQLRRQGAKVEVLNASAASWGIGNHLGYLKELGTFQSDTVILEIGTNDLTQGTSTSYRVGRDPNYPDHSPVLALEEAWNRYLWQQLVIRFNGTVFVDQSPVLPDPAQRFQVNQQALRDVVALVRQQKSTPIALLVPEIVDLLPTSKPPEYKQELQQTLKELQVPAIDVQLGWAGKPSDVLKSYYRDSIHLNEVGNKAVVEVLVREFCRPANPVCGQRQKSEG